MKNQGSWARTKIKSALELAARWLDEEDDPNEPVYDPVHLATVLIAVMSALGVLYWVLWTLLVYEGGLFSKVIPFLNVLFRFKTLADYGYLGSPYAMGIFRGWLGNVSAAGVFVFILILLWRVYQDAALRYGPKR